MDIWVVMSTKGGSGKTTESVHLAHVLAEQGVRVVLLDADPRAGATRWSEDVTFPFPVVGMATSNMHVQIGGALRGRGYDVAVVDTPPCESDPRSRNRAIIRSAARAATHRVLTIAPTTPELDALPDAWDILADVDADADQAAWTGILFNRVDSRTRAPGDCRRTLTAAGHHVMHAQVPRREALAQSFLAPMRETNLAPHRAVVSELLEAAAA